MANDLNIVYRISSDITGLQTGVDKAAKATEGLASTASKMSTAIAGAFTITAVEQFAQTILGAASSFQKMADQTGLSVVEVQKLDFIAGQTDVSVSSLVSAVQNLQQRLGDNNSGAVGALAKLGINAEAFNKLSTYEQVTSLSEAIRGIKDPTEQASLAAAVFGKNWKEILPAIKAGMKDVGDQAVTMSKETVESLGRIDDALKAARATGIAWGGSFVLAIEGAGFALGDFLSKFDPSHFGVANSELLKLAKTLNDPDGVKGAFGASAEAAKKLVTQGMDPLKKILPPTELEIKDLNREIEKSIETNKDAAAASKKLSDESERLDKYVKELARDAFLARYGFKSLGDAFIELNIPANLVAIENGVSGVTAELLRLNSVGTHTDVVAPLQAAITAFAGVTLTNVKPSVKLSGLELGTAFTGGFRTGVHDLPKAILDALKGGGNVAQVVGSTFGADIGQSLNASIQKNIAQNVEDGMGKTKGAFLSGLSDLIPVVGSFLGLAFGKIGDALFHTVEKQINKTRQAFVDAAGGLGALNQKAHEAGVTLDALLDAKKPEAYKKAIDDLTAAFEFQDNAMKFLDDTVKKYGFTIEELGPKFAQQQLTKQAFELEKEFRALEAAGIDVTTITEHMKDAINAYLHDALKTGASVPESFRPILQQLVNMGLLTDANGDAITDLEAAGIHFSKTLDQQFEELIKTIQKLVDAISRGLGTAIENIPNPEITGTVRWDVQQPDTSGAFIPPIDFPTDVQTFATGGIVRGSGSGDHVPALLTPGEMVLTQEQQQALPIQVHVTVQSLLDGQIIAENTVTKMAQDKRGLRTKTQRALGVG